MARIGVQEVQKVQTVQMVQGVQMVQDGQMVQGVQKVQGGQLSPIRGRKKGRGNYWTGMSGRRDLTRVRA